MAVKIADTLKAMGNFEVVQAKDISVDINGESKRLQKAIDDGEIGGVEQMIRVTDELNEKIENKVYYFNNVSDMRDSDFLKDGDMVITKGYYEPNDGGGGRYNVIEVDVASNNMGHILELQNNLKAKLIVENKQVNIKQLGAKGNIDDCTEIFLNAINEYDKIYFPSGYYKIKFSEINNIPRGLVIEGSSYQTTYLYIDKVHFEDVRDLQISNLSFNAIEDTDELFYFRRCHEFKIEKCCFETENHNIEKIFSIRETYYWKIDSCRFTNYGSKEVDEYGYCTWKSIGIEILLGNAGNLKNNTFMYLYKGITLINCEKVNINENFFEHIERRTIEIITEPDNNELLNNDGTVYDYSKASCFNEVFSNRMETHYEIDSSYKVYSGDNCYVYLSDNTFNNSIKDNFCIHNISNFDYVVDAVIDYGIDNIISNNGMGCNNTQQCNVLNDNEFLSVYDKSTNMPINMFHNFDEGKLNIVGYTYNREGSSFNYTATSTRDTKSMFFKFVPDSGYAGKKFFIEMNIRCNKRYYIYISKSNRVTGEIEPIVSKIITYGERDYNYHKFDFMKSFRPNDAFKIESNTDYLINIMVSDDICNVSGDDVDFSIKYIRIVEGISKTVEIKNKKINYINNNKEDVNIYPVDDDVIYKLSNGEIVNILGSLIDMDKIRYSND